MRGMERQPRGDNDWTEILAHRPADQRAAVIQRFSESGVGPEEVRAALADLGDVLCRAAQRRDRDWAEPFGGQVAVALLAAEVRALAAYLNSRASAVRGRAVEALLDDYSAVTVATRLGVSRQKVYEVARADPDIVCIERPRGGIS
jgi:hypothetical protein